MTMTRRKLLFNAALMGLAAGTTAVVSAVPASAKAKVAKHCCAGQNSCKGQGGCGTTKGKNSCKGQGQCSTKTSCKGQPCK